METKQMAVDTEKTDTTMQRCGKISNSESNEEGTAKRKRNDAGNNDLNRHKSRVEVLVDDLQTEMLEVILRYVVTSDLLNCRQMNRKWNEVSSKIMRQRADIQIAFSFQNGRLMQSIQQRDRKSLLKDFGRSITTPSSMSFSDLIERLEQSMHFPFTSFRFKDMRESDNMERFMSIWGRHIYSLSVTVNNVDDIEILRSLLLEKTPNVKKLDIKFGSNWFTEPNIMASAVHLFDDAKEIDLPNLNVFRVELFREKVSGIVADILKAASNLECFEKRSLDEDGWSESITVNDITMLQSLNKLHCLKRVNLAFNQRLMTFLETSPKIMDLQFESIDMSAEWFQCHEYSSQETEIINNIFESSKQSLRKLQIPPLGSISGLVLPIFENLETLYLAHDTYVRCNMFPRLFDMTEHFPNLQNLTVEFISEDDYFSMYQPVNIMPKVELLIIVDDGDRYDEKLMKMMPNVKTLLVAGEDDEPPRMNFAAISTHLTKLENLGWMVYASSQRHLQSSCKLESLITGFPIKLCKKMSVQFRDKDNLSAQEVASYEWKRKYSSIVSLAALKRLDIKFSMGRDFYECRRCGDWNCKCSTNDDKNCDMAGFHRDSNFYKGGLTKVSKFLAFDLMPNLKMNIQHEFIG